MLAPQTKHNLPLLLDQALQSGNPNLAPQLHTPLLKSGLLPSLNLKLFLCYSLFAPRRTILASNYLIPGTAFRWNSLLSALVRRGLPSLAMQTFSLMHLLGLPLCSFSLCSAISAATLNKSEKPGNQIHAYTLKSGWISSIFLGGALINFYVKLGLILQARKTFDEIPYKNSTCANSLLSGHVSLKLWPESLSLMREMAPDEFTLAAALRMCADMPAAMLGLQVHAIILRRGKFVRQDSFLLSLLVEMYGNCGLVENARRAFSHGGGMMINDVVLWTAMLNVYSRNGRFGEVVRTFNEMLARGITPDGVAFVSVLSACSRTADLDLGLEYFRSMREDYGISPWPEHYSCIIHLLSACGEKEKAWELAEAAISPENEEGERIWGSLLVACSEIGDLQLGRRAAARALLSNPSNVGIYVELSNLYARKGMWREIEFLRTEMARRQLRKIVGVSWTERNMAENKEPEEIKQRREILEVSCVDEIQ